MNAEMLQETVITMARHNPTGSSFIVCHVPWALLTQTLLRNGLRSQKSEGLKLICARCLSWGLQCEIFHLWQQSRGLKEGSVISNLFSACRKLMSWVSSTSGPSKGTSNSTGSLQCSPGITSLSVLSPPQAAPPWAEVTSRIPRADPCQYLSYLRVLHGYLSVLGRDQVSFMSVSHFFMLVGS